MPSVSQLLQNLSAGVAAQRQAALPETAPLPRSAADQTKERPDEGQVLPPGLTPANFDLSHLWSESEGALGLEHQLSKLLSEGPQPHHNGADRAQSAEGSELPGGGVRVRCLLSVSRIMSSVEGAL